MASEVLLDTAMENCADSAQIMRFCSCEHTFDFTKRQATIDDVQEAGLLGAVSTLSPWRTISSAQQLTTWLFAWQNMRPVSLVIPGSKPQVDYMGVMQVLRWVQHKQQKDRMQELTKFSTQLEMGLTDMTLRSSLVPTFVHSLAMAAGSWTLKECHLDGTFELRTVVQLLPVTLEKLVLHLGPAMQETYLMSLFSRLPHLQHLAIDLGVPFESLDCGNSEHMFVLDGRLPRLRSLYMCSDPLISLSSRISNLQPHILLPCIEHMAVHLMWHSAPNFVMIHSLRCLKIVLHASPASVPVADEFLRLEVSSGSSLSHLKFISPEKSSLHIHVVVWKAGVKLSPDNVDGVEVHDCGALPAVDCPFAMPRFHLH